MAEKVFHVKVEWDPEAEVYVATSDDIIGLVTEAEDLESLKERLWAIAPELLRENGLLPAADGQAEVPCEVTYRGTIAIPAH